MIFFVIIYLWFLTGRITICKKVHALHTFYKPCYCDIGPFNITEICWCLLLSMSKSYYTKLVVHVNEGLTTITLIDLYHPHNI